MMIKLKNILNELKLNDLVGNQYKYVIGSSEEKYIGENDKKYVLEMIEKSLKTYLYDSDFALNYLDGSQQKEYNSFFEREVLIPMLKKVDFTLNNFFVLDGDKVKWKFSSNDTRKMVDEIFRKNSKVPSDIKKEYYDYRLEYAGVKLKEGINEETKRDYKAEYKKFQSSTEAKKYRAELNKYNRDKGTYGNGDGKDASHKNGKIVGFEDESVNKGRAEKSRLKKEGVNEETVHFKKELKNGNIFQVVDRDTTGMRGTQDKFKMQIVDKRGKVVKDLGSHPSLSGAEKFGNKFESVNEALDPKAEKFLDAIQVNDRSIKDLKNITVDATPQGNWSVYYKGKRMFTLNGKMLDDKTIMKYGLEHMDESLSEGKKIQRPVKFKSVNEANPSVVGNVNAFGPSKVLGKGGKVLGFVPDTPNAIATLIQDYPNVQAIEFKSPFFFDFNSYKSIKKGDKAWKELMSRGVDKATKAALKKDFQLNESELKGYLIADVVDDIIKVIGPRFVSGEIKHSDRNKIYLKLTDVKVGSGVVKLLKSKFGIDAKEEMFGGKDKFGSIPSVSFFSNKVINEELYKVAGRPVTLIKGKKSDGTDWKVAFQNGKETSLSDVLALIKPFPKDVHWRYKNLESVNEAEMNPVKKVVNAILKKHGVNAMKTTSTSVRGFHNIVNNGYSYDGNNFLRFYKVSPDVVEKVADEIQKAGVRVYGVNKSGTIRGDFSKTGLNEAAFKSPDFIVTSIPADAIPSTNISKADVGLGLSMFDVLGRGWTLNNKDYKLDYHNGKVALKLTSSGKTAVRVKSGYDPKYVQKIEKFANDYLSKYAKDIKK
jgi:hypothetical protein